jgi:hypothetical protein
MSLLEFPKYQQHVEIRVQHLLLHSEDLRQGEHCLGQLQEQHMSLCVQLPSSADVVMGRVSL